MTMRPANLVAISLLGLIVSACTGSGFAGGSKKIETPAPVQKPATRQPVQQPSGQVADQRVPPQRSAQPAATATGTTPTGTVPSAQPSGAILPTRPPTNNNNSTNNSVTPPASNVVPPSAARPDDAEPAGQLKVPTLCYVNMEQGYHGTDENYIVQLTDSQGVVAAGRATIEAVRNGEPSDGYGASSGVVMNYDLSYVRPGATSGSGQLNVCYSDPNVAPENGRCIAKSGSFGGEADRPAALQGERASWTVSSESGRPQFSLADNVSLSTHHPVWAYAAPGKCFKDFQSPIVLDLNGNGRFDLVDVWNDATTIHFDLMNDGKPTRTGWVAPGDGLLALDLNGNGTIDSGLELFGEFTKDQAAKDRTPGTKSFDNGFKALAQYDANHDGVIDGKDAVFGKLLVWRDLNQDGRAQKNELQTLAQAGVVDISLAYEKTGNIAPLIVQNNEVRLVSTFHTQDGKSRAMADVWFKQRRYTDKSVAQTSLKK